MESHYISSLVLLAVLGLTDSIYIAWKTSKKQPLACPLNTDCNKVLNSKWSKTFHIKNEYLGILYYTFIIVIAFLWFYTNKAYLQHLLLFSSIIALLFSIFFVYVQKYLIKEYCFYCLISVFINLPITFLALVT